MVGIEPATAGSNVGRVNHGSFSILLPVIVNKMIMNDTWGSCVFRDFLFAVKKSLHGPVDRSMQRYVTPLLEVFKCDVKIVSTLIIIYGTSRKFYFSNK